MPSFVSSELSELSSMPSELSEPSTMPSFMPSDSVVRAFSVAMRVSQLQSHEASALPSESVSFSQAAFSIPIQVSQTAFSVAIQVSQVSLQCRHPSQVSYRLCQIDCNSVSSPPATLWGGGSPQFRSLL
jgi:hypothetical protein